MGKMIVLILSIVMPREIPDIQHVQKMDSFEQCWEAAKDYLNHELTDDMRAKGAIGLSAACAYQAPTVQNN